jgi:hypothetical protein
MNLMNIKIGTKLVWDCQTELYDFKLSKNMPVNYYYPCMVVNLHDRLGALIATPDNRNWMNGEQENLRKPTESELNDLDWDQFNDKLNKS